MKYLLLEEVIGEFIRIKRLNRPTFLFQGVRSKLGIIRWMNAWIDKLVSVTISINPSY